MYSMFNQKGKRKRKGSKAQRSEILYFIWVIGKPNYQEGCIKKVWWEVEVLNHPKNFFRVSSDLSSEITSFQKLSLASRGGYWTCSVPAPDLSDGPD
jgi:hypothetical protein